MTPAFETIHLRPECPQDDAFLFALYASTRQEELEAWGWPPAQRALFLRMQFRASQGYREVFPGADFQIIVVDGQNAGRLVVNRTAEELRLVDLALLPERRNSGIGSAVLQRLCAEAVATQRPIRLRVLKGNRAERWYERLGFTRIGASELHHEMEWRPPTPSHT